MNTVQRGKLGEKIAVNYLTKHGYKLLAKNYYSRWGEIDIIVKDKRMNELVFVEVKTRTNSKFGYPEEAVDGIKLRKMEMTISKFLNERCFIDVSWRIDCMAIELDYIKRVAKIIHYKNIGY